MLLQNKDNIEIRKMSSFQNRMLHIAWCSQKVSVQYNYVRVPHHRLNCRCPHCISYISFVERARSYMTKTRLSIHKEAPPAIKQAILSGVINGNERLAVEQHYGQRRNLFKHVSYHAIPHFINKKPGNKQNTVCINQGTRLHWESIFQPGNVLLL